MQRSILTGFVGNEEHKPLRPQAPNGGHNSNKKPHTTGFWKTFTFLMVCFGTLSPIVSVLSAFFRLRFWNFRETCRDTKHERTFLVGPLRAMKQKTARLYPNFQKYPRDVECWWSMKIPLWLLGQSLQTTVRKVDPRTSTGFCLISNPPTKKRLLIPQNLLLI